jgi:hypothetical protein
LIDFAKVNLPPVKVVNPDIRSVGRSFAANIERIRETILTPTKVADIAMRMQRAADLAEFEITGKLDTDGIDRSHEVALISRTNELYFSNIIAEEALVGTPPQQTRMEAIVRAGTHAVELTEQSWGPRGLGAIMSSCIISAWTAFETMAADLWETALNVHPHGLSELKGLRKNFEGGAEQDQDQSDDRPNRTNIKQLPLYLLNKHEFDMRCKMGTALREDRRFDSLGAIREAYWRAFHKSSEAIAVSVSDKSFEALSAVRNLLVHRSGIVDEEYFKKSQYLPIPRAEIRDPISLDGNIVHSLMLSTTTKSFELLTAVDEWLSAN